MEDIRQIRGSPASRSISNEGRKTWSGRMLLNWYLDELPQLVNILRGEMAFVGPRPDLEDFYKRETIRDQVYWKDLKGGLAGITQACKGNSGRQDTFRRKAAEILPNELHALFTNYL